MVHYLALLPFFSYEKQNIKQNGGMAQKCTKSTKVHQNVTQILNETYLVTVSGLWEG
jgi:hypothetical protein